MTTDFTSQDIINARNDFIRTHLKKGIRYKGRIDRDDMSEAGLKFWASRITGKEILIEYHLFEAPKSLLPIVYQWRFVNNQTTTSNTLT